jgi:hypothetical protein
MQRYENLTLRERENSDTIPRYKAISEALLKTGKNMNIEAAQRILSDHTGYVCSHKSNEMGTLWSVAADVGNFDVFTAEGNPCRTRYKEDLRLKRAIQKHESTG